MWYEETLFMGLAIRKKEERFTYGDYLQWPDEERWELIDGAVYNRNSFDNHIGFKQLGEKY